MDLYIWFDTADEPIGFQFCYDKGRNEHALTWLADSGFSHMRVDAGEPAGALHYKHSPVLTLDGAIDSHIDGAVQLAVTGVQTCALPIYWTAPSIWHGSRRCFGRSATTCRNPSLGSFWSD